MSRMLKQLCQFWRYSLSHMRLSARLRIALDAWPGLTDCMSGECSKCFECKAGTQWN